MHRPHIALIGLVVLSSLPPATAQTAQLEDDGYSAPAAATPLEMQRACAA